MPKPALIYDGHCGFCRMWLRYAQTLTGDAFEWIASQEIGDRYPELARDDFRNSAVLVASDGSVSKGSEAILRVMAHSPARALWLWLYLHFSPFRLAADAGYGLIARHRNAAFHVTRALIGQRVRPLHYALTEVLFLRLLGLTFLFAFWSLQNQMLGLAGSHGVVPAVQVLNAMRGQLGSRAFLFAPSLFWSNPTDACLLWMGGIGIAASIGLIFGGRAPHPLQRLAVLLCFICYLSLVSVGQPFTLFQWDALLLETAFLALFAGIPLLPFAFRLLLFRLMFESGAVKLMSGDPSWRNLHALRYHFMTQPLPTPLAWYAYQAPGWLLDSLTFLTLAIELVCPWLLFCPRRLRHAGAALLIALQVVILLTGNYAFFNWLTIFLCVWAFDDNVFASILKSLRLRAVTIHSAVRRQLLSAVLGFFMLLGGVQLIAVFEPLAAAPFAQIFGLIGPWQVVNSYGLFAVMTTTRPELIYEGSNDGTEWQEFSFPDKPGNVEGPLPLVAPFQPRLDWQLWFAALDGSYQQDRWTGNLAVRLLQGDPAVLKLLAKTPFNGKPKYVRVSLYDYWFTSLSERKRTGALWNRRFERLYLPAISLDLLGGR